DHPLSFPSQPAASIAISLPFLISSSPTSPVAAHPPESSIATTEEMENNLPVNIREYQELAKKALPKMHYDYINGGAEDEHTLRDNIAAYGRILYCSYTASSR
uniref:FMN-dependent dehydrogenase domain-containing protein n=1 Tax=Triticum urartu TaxID=4572 RepID=A0A8R7TF14_TRIUA